MSSIFSIFAFAISPLASPATTKRAYVSSLLSIGLAFLAAFAVVAFPVVTSVPYAFAEEDPIFPVWKLLNQEQKAQYVAGYVQGWKDASKVTDIAIDYVKQNPNEAVSGLERLKALYDLSDLSPSLLVTQLDSFFSDVDNRNASLSFAISAARSGTPRE